MTMELAIIRIKNLRLRTYIGINPSEQENRQDVIINVEIHYPAERASHSDNIEDALNYRAITKKIIHRVENNRFGLLEKMTREILAISSEHPTVQYAQVEIDKPHALRFADSISLMMSYRQ